MYFLRKSLSETCIPYYVTVSVFDIKGIAGGELTFFNNELRDTGSGLDLMF